MHCTAPGFCQTAAECAGTRPPSGLGFWGEQVAALHGLGCCKPGTRPGCFFFVVAPFCSCPASLVSRNFFAVGPGCAKCFCFCCAPLGAATFRRGRSKKKNTTQGVFLFAPAPGKGRGRRSPVPAPNGASPSLAFRRGRNQKKKHPGWCFFFCSGPARTLTHSLRVFLDNNKKCLGYYIESKKTRRGHSKKKHHFRPGCIRCCSLKGSCQGSRFIVFYWMRKQEMHFRLLCK